MNSHKERNRRVDTGKKDSLGRPIYNWEPCRDVDSVIKDLDILFPPVNNQPLIKAGKYSIGEIIDDDMTVLISAPSLNEDYQRIRDIHKQLVKGLSYKNVLNQDEMKILEEIVDKNSITNTMKNMRDEIIPILNKKSKKSDNYRFMISKVMKPLKQEQQSKNNNYDYPYKQAIYHSDNLARYLDRNIKDFANTYTYAIKVPEELKGKLNRFNKFYSYHSDYPAAQEEYNQLIEQINKLAQHYDGYEESPRNQTVVKSIDMAIDQAQEDMRTRLYDEDYDKMIENSYVNDEPCFLYDKDYMHIIAANMVEPSEKVNVRNNNHEENTEIFFNSEDKNSSIKAQLEPFKLKRITMKEYAESDVSPNVVGLKDYKTISEYMKAGFIKRIRLNNNEVTIPDGGFDSHAYNHYIALISRMQAFDDINNAENVEAISQIEQDLLKPVKREGYYTDIQRNYLVWRKAKNIIDGKQKVEGTNVNHIVSDYEKGRQEALQDFRQSQYDFEQRSVQGIFNV